MPSPDRPGKLVADSIHGAIHLTNKEWGVVNTASFQRLRRIKQLGMGHFTYPNATHTRFAHCLGVFGIMVKVLKAVEVTKHLPRETSDNFRLAALLHDVGHYPYSHVMETLDKVQLTEDFFKTKKAKTVDLATVGYPGHEEIGRLIVTNQRDLIDAIGSKGRANDIADIFTRTKAADPQLSKLIHSSLDMDRFDYLLRDSRAAGVPYGSIDIEYLLNNVKFDAATGAVGVSGKALPAAEQFLLARYFMHRAVYYHKTTVAMEETCRQLLRRLRNKKNYNIPKDGVAVKNWVTSARLGDFTDAFVDDVMQQAMADRDEDIQALARAFNYRRPPKLLKEVAILTEKKDQPHAGTVFTMNCRQQLKDLGNKKGISPARFLFWAPKPFTFEERGRDFPAEEVQRIRNGEEILRGEESIKVFVGGGQKAIMDIDDSIMRFCAGQYFCLFRLYVLEENAALVSELRRKVSSWDKGE